MDTNGGRWGEPGINLNSRTHEQINQPVSRQDAKAQRGRERRGNLAGKQETAGKQEESRFNHRGPPRGTEGEGKKGKTMFNIQQGIFNFQERLYFLSKNGLRKKQNEKRVLKTQFGGIVVQRGIKWLPGCLSADRSTQAHFPRYGKLFRTFSTLL